MGIEADDREWDPVTDVNQRGVFLGMRAPDTVHALKKQMPLGATDAPRSCPSVPQVSLTVPGPDQVLDLPQSTRSHGFPCIAAGRYSSFPASIAAKISSCVSPYSERAVLSLCVAPLRPRSSARNSIAGHYLSGRNCIRPVFAGLPADAVAEAGADTAMPGRGSC
jgi:hypothetical protein